MEEIKACLQTITNPKDAETGQLSLALRRLDELAGDESLGLDPKLKHFLQNRSYQKALIWMDGEIPERGICGK